MTSHDAYLPCRGFSRLPGAKCLYFVAPYVAAPAA